MERQLYWLLSIGVPLDLLIIGFLIYWRSPFNVM